LCPATGCFHDAAASAANERAAPNRNLASHFLSQGQGFLRRSVASYD